MSLLPGSIPLAEKDNEFDRITRPICSRNFVTLTDTSNRRQPRTCQWIFEEQRYTAWLTGCTRLLYCIGLRKFRLSEHDNEVDEIDSRRWEDVSLVSPLDSFQIRCELILPTARQSLTLCNELSPHPTWLSLSCSVMMKWKMIR